jgi:AraC-like DNA-binding protein
VRVISRRPRRPELASWVSALWWCDGPTVAESVLPAGRAQLVVRLGGPGAPAGLLHGPASRPRLVEPAPPHATVGVVFRAGGGRPFFDVPADALADRAVPLSELWGRAGSRLAERLADGVGPDAEALLGLVEAALAARARHAVSPLVVDVRRELARGCAVAAVAARFAMDRRVLGALFRREVGFGLKRYARLSRFERALRAVRAADAVPLAQIAARFAFADQAHLTREFVCFAGVAPGRLHRVPGPTPLHVVHDETFKTARPGSRTLRLC